MTKLSAGILLYHLGEDAELKVFLVHPGGPFWKNKDEGAWSIPKGEYGAGEDPLSAAKREFTEETGAVLTNGEFTPLHDVKIKSGKVISAWATQAGLDVAFIRSNQFEMEWPPRSGKKQFFDEVDKADWFPVEEAKIKVNPGLFGFLEQLIQKLSIR